MRHARVEHCFQSPADVTNSIEPQAEQNEQLLHVCVSVLNATEARRQELHQQTSRLSSQEQHRLDDWLRQQQPQSSFLRRVCSKRPTLDYAPEGRLNATILIDGETPSTDMIPAWSTTMDPAEELQELHEPRQMEEAFYMLSTPRCERVEEYNKTLPEHIERSVPKTPRAAASRRDAGNFCSL